MSRSPLLVAAVACVLAFGAAAILLAGARSPEARGGLAGDGNARATAPEEDHPQDEGPAGAGREAPVNPDARAYAEDFGVGLREADRRLGMQGDPLPSRVERGLRKSEPDAFAGLWLRHKLDYGITVATSGNPRAMMDKVEPYVEGTRWEGSVKTKHVEATEAQLKAARAEAERALDRLGIGYSSGENVFKNRIELYVGDEDRVVRKLRGAGVALPERVVVLEGAVMPM